MPTEPRKIGNHDRDTNTIWEGGEPFEELTQIAVSDPKMAKVCQKVGEKVIEPEKEWQQKAQELDWLNQQAKKNAISLPIIIMNHILAV